MDSALRLWVRDQLVSMGWSRFGEVEVLVDFLECLPRLFRSEFIESKGASS